MNNREAQAKMWADLLMSETQARAAQHQVTKRATIYLHAGLPLDQVLDALSVSRATWYRRVEALTAWEAHNRRMEAADRRADERRRTEEAAG
jgi:hypothetical protein